jgi:phage terminase small subunit
MPKVTFLPGRKDALDPNIRNPARQKSAYVPSFSQDKPTCPPGSSAAFKRNFKELAVRLDELGLKSKRFEAIILMAVEQMTEVDHLRAFLAKNSTTYTSTTARGGTTIRARPEVAFLRHAEHSLRMLLKDLGLTPGEHARIGLRRKQNPQNQSAGDWSNV